MEIKRPPQIRLSNHNNTNNNWTLMQTRPCCFIRCRYCVNSSNTVNDGLATLAYVVNGYTAVMCGVVIIGFCITFLDGHITTLRLRLRLSTVKRNHKILNIVVVVHPHKVFQDNGEHSSEGTTDI
uniref:Uncharacterized protein n=1 Tax=Glossina brevipalpis TaxID=37001 RepID=A0A1A9WNK9_9MUSC